GHLVLALGVGPRASAGIISALDVRGGRQPAGEVLAVDLTLYPGFSGGPLIDVRGRVVGITTSGVSRHLQCAIRAGAVGRLVEQVVRGGRIPRAYLGVGTQAVELPEPLRDRLSLAQRTAVIVLNIRSDGPAGAAGVVIGDLIVAIDGHANAHVARGPRVLVRLADDRRVDAHLVTADRRADLAVLRMPRCEVAPAALADSDAVRVGALVVALGHPLGLRRTLTAGVVHAVS